MGFTGFPRQVRFTPVPNPIFRELLEQIDDLSELKCTLRVIWLMHMKRGYPRFLTLGELLSDRTLNRALAGTGKEIASEVHRGLAQAVQRGTLVMVKVKKDGVDECLYALNTEAQRKALAGINDGERTVATEPQADTREGPLERPNIFSLYEDNIGMLSPIIAEELKEAEEAYPQAWIEDAFREAVALNKRSWRYIARILERWEQEGRSNGGPGRYPKKAGYQEYFRR